MCGIDIIIQTKIRELSAQRGLENKRIFLFGYNIYTERINNYLYDEGYSISAILDNDKKKQGNRIYNIPIFAPESVDWSKERTVVLIVSQHQERMAEQIHQLASETEIFILADLLQYNNQWEKKEKFWLEENYDAEIRKLRKGAEVYERIRSAGSLLLLPSPSIGDAFLMGLYFKEYESLVARKFHIVVGSKGAYKVLNLFGIKAIEVSEQELEVLYKFVCFGGSESNDITACGWVLILGHMAIYKRITFAQFIAKYVFHLGNNYQIRFPSIWDKELKEEELISKGLVRGKTVILAPYANSMTELPFQFWECLVERLLERKYNVFTNIAGKQKPVKGSTSLDISLNQLGNYLEYAGYFISIRNGLCDIVGHAKCKQFVIFREGYIAPNSSWITYYDLHSEKISEYANQYIYDDTNFFINIDKVMDFMSEQSKLSG